MRPGDIEWLGSEDMDERGRGKALVTFAASLVLSLLRPARLEATYSHSVPRFAQRPHTGLTLLHLTLEAAQAWQLSRSWGAGRGGASGECNAAMMEMREQRRWTGCRGTATGRRICEKEEVDQQGNNLILDQWTL